MPLWLSNIEGIPKLEAIELDTTVAIAAKEEVATEIDLVGKPTDDELPDTEATDIGVL